VKKGNIYQANPAKRLPGARAINVKLGCGNICCWGTYPRHPTAIMEASSRINERSKKWLIL